MLFLLSKDEPSSLVLRVNVKHGEFRCFQKRLACDIIWFTHIEGHTLANSATESISKDGSS